MAASHKDMVTQHKSTVVRQRQIINAARKLIIRHGSEHVTVGRIAKEVGISEAAIYRHFRSKKDILSLLLDYVEDNLLRDIATKAASGGHNTLEVLDSILRSHLSAVEKRRGVSFQVIAEITSLGDKTLNKKVADTINKYIGRLRDVLSEGVKAGDVREDIDLEAAATLLFGMIQGLVNIWALRNYDFNPEQKYVPLWNIFREAVIKH
jgi:AcrR family transcriptional regulator